ncbi:hypothetical protein CEXT_71691 [Caerostris extrusa]|uniref:3'-phosphate/5'-hydroxy nucleic acid ligase n=1 Tax=Caerostris extrusa TaxID=172846 RepID=A0AAV4NXK2_CAEEX|nr:hypothetical protein CEXT_71691 [Caerostris extrusa]
MISPKTDLNSSPKIDIARHIKFSPTVLCMPDSHSGMHCNLLLQRGSCSSVEAASLQFRQCNDMKSLRSST